MSPLYVSVADAALALDVSEATVRRGVDGGTIPHKRVGAVIRIPVSWLEETSGGREEDPGAVSNLVSRSTLHARRYARIGSGPGPHDWQDDWQPMRTVLVTPTQHEALEALARCGTMKRAAADRGITLSAFGHRIRKVRKRTGLTTVQLMHRLGAGCVLIQDTIWPIAA